MSRFPIIACVTLVASRAVADVAHCCGVDGELPADRVAVLILAGLVLAALIAALGSARKDDR